MSCAIIKMTKRAAKKLALAILGLNDLGAIVTAELEQMEDLQRVVLAAQEIQNECTTGRVRKPLRSTSTTATRRIIHPSSSPTHPQPHPAPSLVPQPPPRSHRLKSCTSPWAPPTPPRPQPEQQPAVR